MTLHLAHTFVSGKSDGSDPTLVQPTDWNAEHAMTQLPGTVLGALLGGSGQTVELPIQVDATGNTVILSTGFFLAAIGTTGQRPGSPAQGYERFNTTLTAKEYYDGAAWQSFASQAFVNTAIASVSVGPGVRQAVNNGPVLSSGLPSFLPASVLGSLNLTTQNLSTTAPLVVSAANGYTSGGRRVDAIGYADASGGFPNLTWAVTNNATNYLFLTINPATNLMTAVPLTLPPIYQYGGAPSVTIGQFTYNISEQKGYLGNGGAAPQAYMVCVGECVASSGSITSTIAYCYNGIFEGQFVTPLPASLTNVPGNHNLGVRPKFADFILECIVADQGYSVGDQLRLHDTSGTDITNTIPFLHTLSTNVNTINLAVANAAGTPFFVISKNPGVDAVQLTGTRWKYQFIAERGY